MQLSTIAIENLLSNISDKIMQFLRIILLFIEISDDMEIDFANVLFLFLFSFVAKYP